MTNVIHTNKCYVHADPRGIILRFMVDDEIAQPILIDEVLAGELHRMFGEFLNIKAKEQTQ